MPAFCQFGQFSKITALCAKKDRMVLFRSSICHLVKRKRSLSMIIKSKYHLIVLIELSFKTELSYDLYSIHHSTICCRFRRADLNFGTHALEEMEKNVIPTAPILGSGFLEPQCQNGHTAKWALFAEFSFLGRLIQKKKTVFAVLQNHHLAFHEDQTGKLKSYILSELEAKRWTTCLSNFEIKMNKMGPVRRIFIPWQNNHS